jgi:type I restriction enzyme S subunit
MSKWKKVKLGDILQVKKGGYITKKEAREGVYPVILGGREPAYFIDRYNHTGKAIVISRSGASAGYVSFWNEPIFVTDGFLIEPKDDITYEFLFYALKSKQAFLHKSQKGAAIPHVTPFLIGDIDFFLPDSTTQYRIATILSRYDTLIENYQKQIKLLEEAALRLYKEWFVDFRFPGYENVKMVDGLPVGWERKKVKEIVNLQNGYAFKSTTFEDEGKYKVVTIKNVKDGVFDGDNVSCIKTIPEKMPSHCILQTGDILLSLTGNVGRVCMVVGKDYLLNQRVAKLKSDYPTFVYCLFRNYDMFVAINNLANGAAQQNVSPIRIGELMIMVASGKTMMQFERMVGEIITKILNLHSQNRLLTEARDRLLPRLMGGYKM